MATQYDQRKYVKVSVINNVVEMNIVEHILSEAGLDFYLERIDDSCYTGVYELVYGYAQLWAPEELKDEINELLSEIRSGVAIIDDEMCVPDEC